MLIAYLEKRTLAHEWYIGETPNWFNLNSERVMQVTADMDELTYILKHFINVPYVDYRTSMTWRGDWAKFIAENL